MPFVFLNAKCFSAICCISLRALGQLLIGESEAKTNVFYFFPDFTNLMDSKTIFWSVPHKGGYVSSE